MGGRGGKVCEGLVDGAEIVKPGERYIWAAGTVLPEEPAVSLCAAQQLRKYPVPCHQRWAGSVSHKSSVCLAVARTFIGEEHGVRTWADANHPLLIFESNQIPFFFFFSFFLCISGNLTWDKMFDFGHLKANGDAELPTLLLTLLLTALLR